MPGSRLPRFGPRFAILTATLAMLGLATSVGIAWVASILESPDPDSNALLGKPTRRDGRLAEPRCGWEAAEWRHRGLTVRFVGVDQPYYFDPSETIHLPRHSAAHGLPPARDMAGSWRLVEKQAGWPFACLRVSWPLHDSDIARKTAIVRGGIACDELSWGFDSDEYYGDSFGSIAGYSTAMAYVALPITPMWGLLVNTAIFAAGWFVLYALAWPLLALPSYIRRRVRHVYGHCKGCGYDMRGVENGGCPECGPDGSRWLPLHPRTALVLALVLVTGLVVLLAVEQRRTLFHPPAVFVAAERGDVAALRRAAVQGVDFSAGAPDEPWGWAAFDLSEEAPLVWAAAHGRTAAVEELLGLGPDPWTTTTTRASSFNTRAIGEIALNHAARRNHVGVCRALLAHVAAYKETQPDHDRDIGAYLQWTAYHAAAAGSFAVIEDLIELGLTPSGDWSILTQAVRGRNPRVVALLLENGHDPNSGAWRDVRSPLIVAYRTGQPEVFELLLDAGADPLARDGGGRGLLHEGPGKIDQLPKEESDRIRLALIRRVLSPEMGLPINVPCLTNKTPLMHAVFEGDTELVRELLAAGADPSVTDDEGLTALDYASGDYGYHFIRGGDHLRRRVEPVPVIIELLQAAGE